MLDLSLGPAEEGAWGLSGRILRSFFFCFALHYFYFTRGRKCCLAATAEELEVWAPFAALVRRWSLQTSRAGDYQPRVPKRQDLCLPLLTPMMPRAQVRHRSPAGGAPSRRAMVCTLEGWEGEAWKITSFISSTLWVDFKNLTILFRFCHQGPVLPVAQGGGTVLYRSRGGSLMVSA